MSFHPDRLGKFDSYFLSFNADFDIKTGLCPLTFFKLFSPEMNFFFFRFYCCLLFRLRRCICLECMYEHGTTLFYK